jgi:class 3 adenylate cyclase
VLQSDMQGFTAMSAIHPPEVVLGILSDMFAKFDMLASHYGVHKVKTIGDAYVAIGGAFNDTLQHDKHEAALRMVELGLTNSLSSTNSRTHELTNLLTYNHGSLTPGQAGPCHGRRGTQHSCREGY